MREEESGVGEESRWPCRSKVPGLRAWHGLFPQNSVWSLRQVL